MGSSGDSDGHDPAAVHDAPAPATVSSVKDECDAMDALTVVTQLADVVEDVNNAADHSASGLPPVATVTPCTASRASNDDEASAARSHGNEEDQTTEVSLSETPRFEPLRAQWRYGQAVFARYKKTPYFYSGNIATYLGAGLFMVVFDDGTLNYRVKREDIVLREYPSTSESQDDDDDDKSTGARTEGSSSAVDHPRGLASTPSPSKTKQSPLKHTRMHWHSNSSIVHQNHMMVDFSMNPPRQFAIRDDGQDAIVGGTDDTLAMKRLECGVGYEDDSTQVSDSDDSNEEDMNITPWQQMTQTFGMGKIRPRASRRSSVSSLSQVDRLSMSQKGMNQILPSPKSLKQTIQDYLSRKTKKVQPSSVGSNVVLFEHIRGMETRARELADKYAAEPMFSTRVVYTHAKDSVRSYGTIKARLANGDYEVITADEQMISVQVFSPECIDILPSVRELELQTADLVRASKKLYAGRKVQVNLYPGSRFSGHGVVTLEVESDATFNVLLQNRIRLLNVPADKLIPLKEKKKDVVTITEDQFLVCSNKTKVYIGDQVFVKCEGEYEGIIEEKIGILNGVFSNKTAAVDFADGSTGYEIAPNLITKRKRPKVSADTDLLSLKNAVLMQASGTGSELLDVGFHVKADHPRKASVETCVVIKKHPSSACDVRFSDGTIAFEVFPSQMILDSVESDAVNKQLVMREAFVDDYVLAWSSRFGRYCSAKVAGKTAEGASSLYLIVFDYGEQKANVPLDKIAPIDLHDALSPTQKLTNYSIDTIGFEIQPVVFTVGEAVAARVHGSAQYYSGWVESVREKERMCVVQFDSSERDEHVPFSAMFSVDARNRFQSISNRMGSSSGGADRLMHFQDESAMAAAAAGDVDAMSSSPTRGRRRHSGGSVGSIIMSVAGSIFRAAKKEPLERRGSHLVTEMGAVLRHLPDP